jgi:hypothetical protein
MFMKQTCLILWFSLLIFIAKFKESFATHILVYFKCIARSWFEKTFIKSNEIFLTDNRLALIELLVGLAVLYFFMWCVPLNG